MLHLSNRYNVFLHVFTSRMIRTWGINTYIHVQGSGERQHQCATVCQYPVGTQSVAAKLYYRFKFHAYWYGESSNSTHLSHCYENTNMLYILLSARSMHGDNRPCRLCCCGLSCLCYMYPGERIYIQLLLSCVQCC